MRCDAADHITTVDRQSVNLHSHSDSNLVTRATTAQRPPGISSRTVVQTYWCPGDATLGGFVVLYSLYPSLTCDVMRQKILLQASRARASKYRTDTHHLPSRCRHHHDAATTMPPTRQHNDGTHQHRAATPLFTTPPPSCSRRAALERRTAARQAAEPRHRSSPARRPSGTPHGTRLRRRRDAGRASDGEVMAWRWRGPAIARWRRGGVVVVVAVAWSISDHRLPVGGVVAAEADEVLDNDDVERVEVGHDEVDGAHEARGMAAEHDVAQQLSVGHAAEGREGAPSVRRQLEDAQKHVGPDADGIVDQPVPRSDHQSLLVVADEILPTPRQRRHHATTRRRILVFASTMSPPRHHHSPLVCHLAAIAPPTRRHHPGITPVSHHAAFSSSLRNSCHHHATTTPPPLRGTTQRHHPARRLLVVAEKLVLRNEALAVTTVIALTPTVDVRDAVTSTTTTPDH